MNADKILEFNVHHVTSVVGHCNIYVNVKNGIIEITISTPEHALEIGYTYKGWKIAIEKSKSNSRNTRVVINGLDKYTMEEISNYKQTLNDLVDFAYKVLNDPPEPDLISQGVIELENHSIKFVPRKDL